MLGIDQDVRSALHIEPRFGFVLISSSFLMTMTGYTSVPLVPTTGIASLKEPI